MLHHTRGLRVVFTEAYPALAGFAERNFLPSHPLARSNVWLEEPDFIKAQQRAVAHGLPSPLVIDPLAHDPQRSPYATTQSKKRKKRPTTATGQSPGAISTSISDVHPSNRWSNHTSSSQHRVPICSISVTRALYLFNLDQMFIPIIPSSSSRGELPDEATTTACGRHLHDDAYFSCLDHNPHCEDAARGRSCASVWKDFHFDGARLLRLQFRSGLMDHHACSPAAIHCHPPGPAMRSLQTGKAYSEPLSQELRLLASRFAYRSSLWGTFKGWKRVGATALPLEQPHILPQRSLTKLIHISLVRHGEALLREGAFISGKTGAFIISGAESLRSDFNGLGGPSTVAEWMRTTREGLTQEDQQHHPPVFFSGSLLRRCGLTIRPGEVGFCADRCGINAIPDALESLDLPSASPNAHAAHHFLYHISQLHLPSTFRISSEVIHREMEDRRRQRRGEEVEVVARHAITGQPLPYAELQPHHLHQRYPELSPFLVPLTTSTPTHERKDDAGSSEDASFAEEVEWLSCPSNQVGRSLWMRAEEVLQHDGIVEVNATPVEIITNASAEGEDELTTDTSTRISTRALYHISSLEDPSEGLRCVNGPHFFERLANMNEK